VFPTILDRGDVMNQAATTGPIPLAALRGEMTGEVIGPDDAGYDEARVVTYREDARPALIIRAADAGDVARAVDLARDSGLELAVRSGGHSGVGHGTTDGGIVLDLSPMKGIDIDVAGRTVWAETGLTAGELSTAVGEHGLVIGFGDTGSVGIGGITVGGGVGYLARKFGLTIDNVLAADVVTADGTLVRTDAEHEPDLFWAIRGGGGNFGVVTRFQYRLHELPSIVGGMLLLPATPEVIAGFIAAAEAAPEELSAIANVMPVPPMPFVPAEQHGTLGLMALMTWAGETEAGQRALAPFRALATPIADMLRPMTYAEMFPPEEEGGPKFFGVNRTFFVDHVDVEMGRLMLERIEEHGRTTDALFAAVQIRVLGGAVSRIPVDATAYAHRKGRIMVNVAAVVSSLEATAGHTAWLDDFAAALGQGDDGKYVNFVLDEGKAGVRQAYPGATWDRLTAIKRRYDPTNLFRLNQNIPPA
jgi:FAD/FMN-containing dehydrogenase